MFVLKYFKNTPRSPPIGRQALIVIFFLQIRNEVPGKKKGACPPPSPHGRQGPVAHPRGDRGLSPVGGATGASPYLSPGRHSPPFPLSFESKIQEKKRGVRRRKAAKFCRIAYS